MKCPASARPGPCHHRGPDALAFLGRTCIGEQNRRGL